MRFLLEIFVKLLILCYGFERFDAEVIVVAKFHVNVETGQVGSCGARKGRCPFGGASGAENHYDSEVDALRAGQEVLEGKHGKFSTVTKKKNTVRKISAVSKNSGNSKKAAMEEFFARKDDWDRERFVEPQPVIVSGSGFVPRKGCNFDKLNDLEKYDPAAIAKHIREDLKIATNAGYLPKGLKFSVRSGGSGGSSIVNVSITGFGRDDDVYDWEQHPTKSVTRVMKKEYRGVQDRVEKIYESYNYDNSNPMTDYFDRGYYGGVSVRTEYDAVCDNLMKVEKKMDETEKEMLANGASDYEVGEFLKSSGMEAEYKSLLQSKHKADCRSIVARKWSSDVSFDRGRFDAEVDDLFHKTMNENSVGI